jgi:hypothetical protein
MGEAGTRNIMTEVSADNEAQLHDIVKETPELLPSDEFGISGPLLVVGREISLQSGFADLVCVSTNGDLIIVELKTGAQNADFRKVLAQLIDYGADLWRMSYEEFESAVALRFFASDYASGDTLSGKQSLAEAAREFWRDFSDEEVSVFRENLSDNLSVGSFHYVLVSQNFTSSMENTIEYLNFTNNSARFYGVELVRFAGDRLSVFEARTVLKPDVNSTYVPRRRDGSDTRSTNEGEFLSQIPDVAQRESLENLLEGCRGLGFRIEKGKRGLTIRLSVQERSEPVTVAWLFPPGVTGWMGLTELNFGFDTTNAHEKIPSTVVHLEKYVDRVSALTAGREVERNWFQGRRIDVESELQHHEELMEILAKLVRESSE